MNQWICVKERLPEINQKVLFHWVLTDSFGTPGVKNVSMGYRCSEGWNIYLPYHSFGLRADVCPVTHWMELTNYPSENTCTHENIDMEPVYQCENCKKYVRMD